MFLKAKRSREWTIEEGKWDPGRNEVWESLFCLANGYIGIRGFPEEPFEAGPTSPGIFIAGVFGSRQDMVPQLVNVANFLSAEISMEDEKFKMIPGKIPGYSRILDMRRGLLQRTVVYSSSGRTTKLEFERFASIAHPHRVSQSITVTPLDWSGRVSVWLWMDAGSAGASNSLLKFLHSQHMGRDRILMATESENSKTRIAHACRCASWVAQVPPPKAWMVGEGAKIGFRYDVVLESGQKAVFNRVTATYTSIDPDVTSVERCCLDDVRGISDIKGVVYGVRRRRHVEAWSKRWDNSDIRIDGPSEDQKAIRFAIFHLNQVSPVRDMFSGIGAKGLSGEGYRGHVFWDTEIFMLPFYICSDPNTARRILQYRYHTLPGAMRKAKSMGYEGAMFAWESAATGDETCPSYVPDPKTGAPVRVLTGELQHHISADVVFGAWKYFLATGDGAFQEKELLSIAVFTARFWSSRVEIDDERKMYVLRNVIGPDEFHEGIDNNAYTNFMAHWNLKFAAGQAERMLRFHKRSYLVKELGITINEIQKWRSIADNLFVPGAVADGVIEQHEGFFRLQRLEPRLLSSRTCPDSEEVRMKTVRNSQILKQADVLMLMVLFPDNFTRKSKIANWKFYEPLTVHDSSLSPGIHSIAASDLELKSKAYAYFKQSAKVDLNDSMGNTRTGLHLASLGAIWQAVTRGFLGLKLEGPEPILNPRLPAAWKHISMKIEFCNVKYLIEADQDGFKIIILDAERRRGDEQ